jgi:hypothetical protein
MAAKVTLQQVEASAIQLSPDELARLVERLSELTASGGQAPRTDWMSLRGVAPGLLDGEDAQHWVSRTRRGSDKLEP